jgi:hypothetical protein
MEISVITEVGRDRERNRDFRFDICNNTRVFQVLCSLATGRALARPAREHGAKELFSKSRQISDVLAV